MLAEMTAGDNSDYYSHIRGEISQLLPADIGRVLEIGCGRGDTLAWLKSLGKTQSTYGIELFADSADAARSKVDHVLCGDFETLPLPESFSGFDVILCLDVLEHFVDPWKALARIGNLLAPGGASLRASLMCVISAWCCRCCCRGAGSTRAPGFSIVLIYAFLPGKLPSS